jgi:hypothetical protein
MVRFLGMTYVFGIRRAKSRGNTGRKRMSSQLTAIPPGTADQYVAAARMSLTLMKNSADERREPRGFHLVLRELLHWHLAGGRVTRRFYGAKFSQMDRVKTAPIRPT